MDDLKEYVVALYSRCKNPVKQIGLICDLTGRGKAEVLKILRDAGRIPAGVTAKNYKKELKPQFREITEEMRHHLVASNRMSKELAKQFGLSVEQVNEVRREAYERVGGTFIDGDGAAKEFKARCARYEKNAQRDGKRAGKGNRRVCQKRPVGA